MRKAKLNNYKEPFMNKNKIRVAMILTREEHETLKKISKGKGLSFSELIRRILDKYIEKNYDRK